MKWPEMVVKLAIVIAIRFDLVCERPPIEIKVHFFQVPEPRPRTASVNKDPIIDVEVRVGENQKQKSDSGGGGGGKITSKKKNRTEKVARLSINAR